MPGERIKPIKRSVAISGGGDILEIIQVNHGFDDDFVYYNGSSWVKAIADDPEHCATHFARRVTDDKFQVYNSGEINISGLVNGEYYWLSQLVEGTMTINEPYEGVIQSVLKANETGRATILVSEPYVPGPLVDPDIIIDGGVF